MKMMTVCQRSTPSCTCIPTRLQPHVTDSPCLQTGVVDVSEDVSVGGG